jgi:hypothetical protein
MQTFEQFIKEENDLYTSGNFYQEKYKIFELLKHSLPSEKIESIITEYITNADIEQYVKIINHLDPDDYLDSIIKSDKNNDTIEINIDFNNKYPLKYIEIIISKIVAGGWYIALLYIDDTKTKKVKEFIKNIKNTDFKNIKMICERKYPIENIIYTNDILYHLTTMSKLKKIKINGLNPKNSGAKKAYHPKRIYFCKNMNCINNFIDNLRSDEMPSIFTNYINKNEKYAILSIDPSKLFYYTPNDKKEQIYFFNDYRKKDSLYTNFNIKPEFINVIKENI